MGEKFCLRASEGDFNGFYFSPNISEMARKSSLLSKSAYLLGRNHKILKYERDSRDHFAII